MSIDARVVNIIRHNNGDATLELINGDPQAIAGQPSLTIIAPKRTLPPIGTRLWGNSNKVFWGMDDVNRYSRIGYTKLKEEP